MLLLQFNVNSQDTIVINSTFLNYSDTCLVFTPTSYNPNGDSLPLVYMLHGYGGNQNDMSRILNLKKIANQYNFIIACPDGTTNSWYFDSPRDHESKYESFFISELIPEVNSKYKIDTTNIFITGLSMGGHGAMYIFLRNNRLFKSAGSSSGTLILANSSQKFLSLSDKLGEYEKSKDLFDKYSSINLLDSIKFGSKKIIVDCGYNDRLYESSVEFNKKAIDLKVDITFISMPGWHNSEYWSKSFQYHLAFFASQVETKN